METIHPWELAQLLGDMIMFILKEKLSLKKLIILKSIWPGKGSAKLGPNPDATTDLTKIHPRAQVQYLRGQDCEVFEYSIEILAWDSFCKSNLIL